MTRTYRFVACTRAIIRGTSAVGGKTCAGCCVLTRGPTSRPVLLSDGDRRSPSRYATRCCGRTGRGRSDGPRSANGRPSRLGSPPPTWPTRYRELTGRAPLCRSPRSLPPAFLSAIRSPAVWKHTPGRSRRRCRAGGTTCSCSRPPAPEPRSTELSAHRPVLSGAARSDLGNPDTLWLAEHHADKRLMLDLTETAESGPLLRGHSARPDDVRPARGRRPIGRCRRRCGHHDRPVHPIARGTHHVIGIHVRHQASMQFHAEDDSALVERRRCER